MYKVIFNKKSGLVVSIYPFEYDIKTVYYYKDGESEIEINENEISLLDADKIIAKTEKIENVSFFYNKDECDYISVVEIPEHTKNQYLVYQNGGFIVKNRFTYEQLVERYIRDKYTISQELALLRQKETKPLEYQEYFEYAEYCKSKAKKEIGNG